jgi:DNA-binding IclR family transcriptional regulator
LINTPQFEAAGKLISIITSFCGESTEWGVRELASHLGLPKSTVHRILQTLAEVEWLSYDEESKHYKVGMELFRISSILSQRVPIINIAKPYLKALAEETGEASILCIYQKAYQNFTFLDMVQSSHILQYSIQLGVPRELYAGATGRSIMAFLPEEEQMSIMNKMTAITEKTLNREQLIKELEKTRKLRYAVSYGERISGSVSIAAPFWGVNGIVGSLAITVPAYRMKDQSQTNEWSMRVLEESEKLTLKLGGKLPIEMIG